MMMMDICTDGNVQDMEMEKLKEKYFKGLLGQLKINEKHQVDQDSLLLEMFLAYIYSKKISDFKEFIRITIDETHKRLEIKLQSYRTSNFNSNNKWDYELRKSAFTNLSNNMKVLYYILRDSIHLEQQKFLEKYAYLRMEVSSFGIVKQAAGCFKKEEYFWIVSLKLGHLNGFYWNQVYDAVFECTTPYSSDNDILAELSGPLPEEHVLLQSIETSLKDKVPNGKLTKKMRQKVIVPFLKEFFVYDNPFNGAARYSLKSSAVVEKVHAAKGSSIITAVISPMPVIEKAGAAVNSPNAVIEKAGATEGSSMAAIVSQTATTVSPPPPIGRVNQECVRSINAILSSLQIKETSKLSNSTAVKTHRSKSATKKSSVSVLANFLKATKIPAQDALKFFEKKRDMAPTCEIRSYVKFSSFGEDDLINGKGIRSYIAKDASSLAAGFCTCIVHAIRLLCLCTTATIGQDLEKVLKIMVTDIKTKRSWDVDEVMSGLNLELSSITFQSLAHSFAVLIGQSTYLGELSWTGISSRTKLIQEVKVLYDSNDANKGKNMLFISFSQVPAVKVFDLPYVFHVNVDDDVNKPDVSFQTVGMVYSSLEGDKPASFAFHFITYSRCFEDGQYQVYEHLPFPKGKINGLHKVSHSLEKAKKGEEPLIPIKLRVLLNESGHSLVGLILIRNNKQTGAEHPYLKPEVIRCIPNPLTSAGSDPCELTCAELQKLNSNGIWLDDLLVQAIVHLLFESLLQKRSSNLDMQISLQSSLAYELLCSGNYSKRRKLSLQKLFSSSQHNIFFIVNVGNYHWICLCLSMKWRRIFSLDSKNGYSTCQSKASEVMRVLRDHFNIRDIEWVHLKSPHQRDGTSCGIFTALNSAFLLKSILKGSFTSAGPTDMKEWGDKIFTEVDKLSIRACTKDVIYGDADVASLLEWIN